MEPPTGFPVQAALEARKTVYEFWAAMGRDDDDEVARLMVSATLDRNGFTAGPGLAQQVRDAMGLTVSQCASMGGSEMLCILSSGDWAFQCMPVWRPVLYEGPTLVKLWAIVTVRDEAGAWRVWGSPEADDAVVGKVRLPLQDEPAARA